MKRSVSNKSRSEAHPVAIAPVPYLLVEVRESEQGAQGFLPRNRFEDAVALLQRRAGVGRRRVPSQLGLDWHSCLRGQHHRKPVFIVSRGSSEGSLPLLVRPAVLTATCQPTGSPTPTLSVIVFRGVSQCPLVHVQLRRLACAAGDAESRRLSYDPSDFALRRDSSYREAAVRKQSGRCDEPNAVEHESPENPGNPTGGGPESWPPVWLGQPRWRSEAAGTANELADWRARDIPTRFA